MPFKNAILAGTELIREAIESPNFVSGVTGWQIARDGSAEFNSLVARGGIEIGDAQPGNNAASWGSNPPTALLAAGFTNAIVFYSTDWDPASTTPKVKYKFIGTTTTGDAIITGFALVMNPSVDPTEIIVLANFDGYLPDVSDNLYTHFERKDINNIIAISISAEELVRFFAVWDTAGVDRFTVIAGGASTRTLMEIPSPGSVDIPDLRHVSDYESTIASTASTSFVDLGSEVAVTFPYPRSGVITVSFQSWMRNNSTAAYGLMSVEIRDDHSGGTLRVGASNSRAIQGYSSTPSVSLGTRSLTDTIAGLPIIGTGYARLMYRSGSAAMTASFGERGLVIMPSP